MAAELLREVAGSAIPLVEQDHYERDVSAVRQALSGEAFAAAWAEGRAMPLEEAVRYALEEALRT